MKGFVKYLMLLVVGIAAASCVFEAEKCDMSTDKLYNIMFTVSVKGQNTRAAWEEEYPELSGVQFDYRIMPNDLRVVLFTQYGERLGVINELDYWPINEAHTEFQFVGKLPKEFIEHLMDNRESVAKYRFMALANCADNGDDEEYLTYSHNQLDPLNEQSAIPMWGVKEADVSPLFNRGSLDIGDISLLRAAAKVEVKLC